MLETPDGEELFTIQEKKLSLRDKMEFERGGKAITTVEKALVSRSATASRSTSITRYPSPKSSRLLRRHPEPLTH